MTTISSGRPPHLWRFVRYGSHLGIKSWHIRPRPEAFWHVGMVGTPPIDSDIGDRWFLGLLMMQWWLNDNIGMVAAPSRWRNISKQKDKMGLLNFLLGLFVSLVSPLCLFKCVQTWEAIGIKKDYRIRFSRSPNNSKTDWDMIWATIFRMSIAL